ncbi:hypothetical protein PJJ89_29090, partial [Mycobacterium kansasii]
PPPVHPDPPPPLTYTRPHTQSLHDALPLSIALREIHADLLARAVHGRAAENGMAHVRTPDTIIKGVCGGLAAYKEGAG